MVLMQRTIHVHGQEVVPYRHRGLFRADHAGLHFVSSSWAGIVAGLGRLNSLSVQTHTPPAPPESPEDRVRRVLSGIGYSLKEKQAAYHEAKRLGVPFDPPKPLSFAARSFARKLDKPFDEITYEELVQHEHNLVKRNSMIRELADIFSIHKMDKECK